MGADEARENRADNYREEAETTHGGLLLKVRGKKAHRLFYPRGSDGVKPFYRRESSSEP